MDILDIETARAVAFVRGQREAGRTDPQIRQRLLADGWGAADAAEILAAAPVPGHAPRQVVASTNTPYQADELRRRRTAMAQYTVICALIVGLAVLLLGAGLGWWGKGSRTDRTARESKSADICNLCALAGWTRVDFDTHFGSPLSVDMLPNGRADAIYASQGTSYAATFTNASSQATMTSLLVEAGNGFADADDLISAVGFDPVPAVVAEAPARRVYSTVGTSLMELAAMRSNGLSGDWSMVFVQLEAW